MLLATALLIIGLLLVVYSADRLVFAASILCRLTGVPPVVIGMTVVSVGTSLPEIIVSVSASLHGQLDLAVGTAIVAFRQYPCLRQRKALILLPETPETAKSPGA